MIGYPYFETGIAAAAEDRALCYPCSLAQLPDGRLVATFCDGRGCVIYSADNGRTWSGMEALFHPDAPFAEQPDCAQSFVDTAVVVYKDRVEALNISLHRHEPPWLDLSATRVWRRTSFDSGKSWGPIAEVPMHKKYVCGITNAGLRLSDGSIILGYSWEENAEKGGAVPDGEGAQSYVCGILRTVDEGAAWRPGGDVRVGAEKAENRATEAIGGADEPACAELPDGSLYMLIRTGTDRLWETRSRDRGATWDEARPSPLVSHNCPAALLRLADGDVLVVYNDHPKTRSRLCARVSGDGCRSWSAPKVFAPIGFTEEPYANYPVLCQTGDGMVVAVWGQWRAANPNDRQKICYARFNKEWAAI